MHKVTSVALRIHRLACLVPACTIVQVGLSSLDDMHESARGCIPQPGFCVRTVEKRLQRGVCSQVHVR